MTTKKPRLIPPDRKRCQVEKRNGTFMSFGPTKLTRCKNRAEFIAQETKPGEDGRKGSMSLCGSCAQVCLMQFPSIGLIPIERSR